MNLRRNIFCIGENYVEHVGEFEKNFNMEIQKNYRHVQLFLQKLLRQLLDLKN